MKNSMHDFHFIIDQEDYLKLKEMRRKYKISVSEISRRILNKMTPFLEKIHLFKTEELSKQKRIKNPVNRHIYLEESAYRKIKQIHDNNNIYSMGIIIRNIIKIFLKYHEKYGFDKLIIILDRYRTMLYSRIIRLGAIYKKIHMSQNIFPYNTAFYFNNSNLLKIKIYPRNNYI